MHNATSVVFWWYISSHSWQVKRITEFLRTAKDQNFSLLNHFILFIIRLPHASYFGIITCQSILFLPFWYKHTHTKTQRRSIHTYAQIHSSLSQPVTTTTATLLPACLPADRKEGPLYELTRSEHQSTLTDRLETRRNFLLNYKTSFSSNCST